MNYKLAKQLKDAGFPQVLKPHMYAVADNGSRIGGKFTPTFSFVDLAKLKDDEYYIPTLEELIRECIGSYKGKYRNDFVLNFIDDRWDAGIGNTSEAVRLNESYPEFFERGSTKEEAVAKLWLALNKK